MKRFELTVRCVSVTSVQHVNEDFVVNDHSLTTNIRAAVRLTLKSLPLKSKKKWLMKLKLQLKASQRLLNAVLWWSQTSCSAVTLFHRKVKLTSMWMKNQSVRELKLQVNAPTREKNINVICAIESNWTLLNRLRKMIVYRKIFIN